MGLEFRTMDDGSHLSDIEEAASLLHSVGIFQQEVIPGQLTHKVLYRIMYEQITSPEVTHDDFKKVAHRIERLKSKIKYDDLEKSIDCRT